MGLLRKQQNAAGKVASIEERCGERRRRNGTECVLWWFPKHGEITIRSRGQKKVESTVRRKSHNISSKCVKYHSDQNNSLHHRGWFWQLFWYRATAREIRLKSEGGVAEMQFWAKVTGRKYQSMVWAKIHASQTARGKLHRYAAQKWFYRCVL